MRSNFKTFDSRALQFQLIPLINQELLLSDPLGGDPSISNYFDHGSHLLNKFAAKIMAPFKIPITCGVKMPALEHRIPLPIRVSCLGLCTHSTSSTWRHSRCTAPQLLASPSINSGFIKFPAAKNASYASVSTNAAASATAHLAATTLLFTASTIFTAILGVLMIFFPTWSKTRQLLHSPWSITPIAVAYGIILGWSWQPDTFSLILPGNLADGLKGGFNPQFFPSLAGIVTLFSRVATAASLWVHILAINVFAAREIYLDGELLERKKLDSFKL